MQAKNEQRREREHKENGKGEKKENMSKQDAPLTVGRMKDKGVRFVLKEGDTHDGRLF